MKKKVVLFDIDGTILNVDGKVAYGIFVDVISEVFGVDVSESLPSFHGKTDLQILSEIFDRHHISNGSEKIQILWQKLYDKFSKKLSDENINLLPGIKEFLKLIHSRDDYLLGLVTGNFRRNAYLKLRVKELDSYFNFGTFGCDDFDRNVLPDIAISRAIESNLIPHDFDVKNSIIIGDTHRDVECARSCGMPVVAVATGKASVKDLSAASPDYLFENLSNYNEIFNTLENHFDSVK